MGIIKILLTWGCLKSQIKGRTDMPTRLFFQGANKRGENRNGEERTRDANKPKNNWGMY